MVRALAAAVLFAGGLLATHQDSPAVTRIAVAPKEKRHEMSLPRVSRRHERLPLAAVRTVPPRPQPASSPRPLPALQPGHNWDAVARCESGNDWHINTGNGYMGGLQMDAAFWANYGGLSFAARPDLATREQQITVAERGLKAQGIGAWPTCGYHLLEAS